MFRSAKVHDHAAHGIAHRGLLVGNGHDFTRRLGAYLVVGQRAEPRLDALCANFPEYLGNA